MQFPPSPYNNCMPTIVLCKYVLAVKAVNYVFTRNYVTRNYAGCDRGRNFSLVTIQIYLLA